MPTTEQIEALTIGMTEQEIMVAVGAPDVELSPTELLSPGKVLAELGSGFRFDDCDLDAVWTYGHPVRRKLRFCLGLKDGRLKAKWRLTQAGK